MVTWPTVRTAACALWTGSQASHWEYEEDAALLDGDEPAEQSGDKEPIAPATNSKLPAAVANRFRAALDSNLE